MPSRRQSQHRLGVNTTCNNHALYKLFVGYALNTVFMAKTKGNTWEDHYAIRARKEGFAARSVYKLKEIQEKFAIIKKNDKVLDLGSAPGSWLQYAAQMVGKNGRVVGIDLKKIEVLLPVWVETHIGDIFEMNSIIPAEAIGSFNVVMSDMAPATTGRKDVDAQRSLDLCREAIAVSQDRLMAGGNFVCKIFQGAEFKEFSDSVKETFLKHKIFKPESCRKNSKEIYIIGIGKK